MRLPHVTDANRVVGPGPWHVRSRGRRPRSPSTAARVFEGWQRVARRPVGDRRGRIMSGPANDGRDHAGARVAVLLCGYGEVESNDDLVEYNAKSLRLLVSKSVKFPDVTVPFLSRRLAKQGARGVRAGQPVRLAPQRHLRAPAGRDRRGAPRALRRPGGGLQGLQLLRRATCRRTSCRRSARRASSASSSTRSWWSTRSTRAASRWSRSTRLSATTARGCARSATCPASSSARTTTQRLAEHVREGVAPLRERWATSQIGVVLLNHGCPYKAKGFETGIRESRALYHARQGAARGTSSRTSPWAG